MTHNDTGVQILRDEKGLMLSLDPSKLPELAKLLDRGLNTWERAPTWLLQLSEIAR